VLLNSKGKLVALLLREIVESWSVLGNQEIPLE
jgi:hypothetical protein